MADDIPPEVRRRCIERITRHHIRHCSDPHERVTVILGGQESAMPRWMTLVHQITQEMEHERQALEAEKRHLEHDGWPYPPAQ